MKAKTRLKTEYSEAVKEHSALKKRYEEYPGPPDSPVRRQLYLRMCKAWDRVVTLNRYSSI